VRLVSKEKRAERNDGFVQE